MKGRWLWLSVALSLVFALFSFQGCSATRSTFGKGGPSADNGTTVSTGGGSLGQGGDNCLLCGTGGSGGASGGNLSISPGVANLDVKGGSIPTQQFTATYNGQDVTSLATWVVEKPDMGIVAKGGLFTPTGKVGGITKVLALFAMQKAEAAVTINVAIVTNTAGLTAAQQAAFDAPKGADPTMTILYPFDKTVMPLRVLSPEVMWQGGNGNDQYRLRMTSKYISFTEYFTAPAALHAVPQKQWEDIEFSGTGPISDPVKVELSRMSNGTAYSPKTLELRIAQGIIYGSIYYWQLPDACMKYQGRVMRIKPSSEMTDEFYPTTTCFGCHTVSRDGTRMMATFDLGSFNGFPMQTLDLTKNPVQLSSIQQAQGVTGVFAAYNDDGSKIAYSDNFSGSKPAQQAAVHIIDAKTGQKILNNAFPPGCGEPAWSPDGTLMSAVCGMDGFGWTFDSSNGDLKIATLNKAQNQVMSSKTIVPKGAQLGRPAYPTFSPDSKYLVFGRPTQGSRSSGEGTLWLSDVSGAGQIMLTKASNDNHSYNPVFAPKSAGGYTWIVYISKRNYGNKLQNANRQQLWMTAIEDPPQKNVDPSNPPFYIRGQFSCDKSENAYYALDPCKKDGSDCEHGIECCNKSCIYDEKLMKHVCKPPDGTGCIPTGSGTCKADSDCCDFGNDVFCLNGFCELKPPK